MRNAIAICLLAMTAAVISGCGGGGTRGNPVAPMPVAGAALTISGTAKAPAGAVSAARTAGQASAVQGLRNLASGTARAFYIAGDGATTGGALASASINSSGGFTLALPANIKTVPSNLVVVVTSGATQMRAFVASRTSLQVNPVSDYAVSKIVASGQAVEYFSMEEFADIYSRIETSIINQSINFSSYTSVTAAVNALQLNTTLATAVGQGISAATVPEVLAVVTPSSGTLSDVYKLTCTVSGGSYTLVQGRCDDVDNWLTLSGGALSCTYPGSGIYTPECRVDNNVTGAANPPVTVGLPTDTIIITGRVMALYMVLAGRASAAATNTVGISPAANYSVALYSNYESGGTAIASSTTDINGDFILALPKSVTSLNGDNVVVASRNNDSIRSFVVRTTDLIVSPQSDYIVMETLDSGYPLNSFTTAELAWIDTEVEKVFKDNNIEYSRYQSTLLAVEDIESKTVITSKTARLIELSSLPDGYGADYSGIIPYISNSGNDFGLFVMSSSGSGITKLAGGDNTISSAAIIGDRVVYQSTLSSGAVTELKSVNIDGSGAQSLFTFVPNSNLTHLFGRYNEDRILYPWNSISGQTVESLQLYNLEDKQFIRIWDNGTNYQNVDCPVRYDRNNLLVTVKVCTTSPALCDFVYGMAKIDMASGNLDVIVDNVEVASCPAVSSNGSIVFSGRGSTPQIATPYQLYSVDINGNNLTQLTYDLGSSRHPLPLANGRIAYEYWNTAVRNCDIYVIKEDGTGKANITNTASSDEVLYGYNLKYNKAEAGDDVGNCFQPPPRPIITASVTSGIAPLLVYFKGDVITGTPESYIWDFGDGTSSDAQNPVHTYTSSATYTVSLSVTDKYGGRDTTTEEIVVSMGITWKRTYNFKIYDAVETSDGGFVMAGSYNTPDSVLLKLDSRGTTVWQRNISRAYAFGLVQTTDDGYLVSGQSGDTSAPLLMKFNSSGIKLWEQAFTAFSAPARRIISRGDGNYLIGGSAENGNGFLIEVDGTGNIEWSAVMTSPCGNMPFYPVITGGAVYVRNNSCVEGAPSSLFILDSTGFTQFSYAVGNINPSHVVQAQDGNIVMSGIGGTCDSSTFSPCTTAWFYKINTEGTLVWQNEYDADGSSIESSDFIDRISGGGLISVGSRDSNPSPGNIALYLLKLDPLGDLEWEKEYGDYPAFQSPVVKETSDGGFIITGITGTTTFLESVIVKLNVNGECDECF